jgi:hypothetical protein
MAKAMVASRTVKFSLDVGLQSVILEGDSLQVVNALKEEKLNWSKYGQIVKD